ncbi:MAG: DUF4838 domain-containing protein [Clostridia bacterium]|nr:DUF4838 domain-containing protein [Clostridia bacterium]
MIKEINVIIPKTASELEIFAAEELKFFLHTVSDVNAVITKEKGRSLSAPFISVGETELFGDVNGIELIKEVGEDGYRIISNHECAYICGGAGQGTIFGVYRFLKEFFNLKIYTETVYTYDFKPYELKNRDIIEKPDIPMRALGIYPVHLEKREPDMGNKRYCYRMRLRQMDEGWGINNHCYFRVLPPSKYKDEHPDWYSESGKQLCLTNKGVIAEYVKNMKAIIESSPDDSLYMIGMEDTLEQCHCKDCKAVIDEYGYSALTLIFCNTVAKELNAWIKEVYPKRKVFFFTFAYVWAIEPPIKKVDGKFVPLVDGIEIEDNLGVLIAPLYTSTNYCWNDPRAKEALTTNYYEKRIALVDIFNGWKAVVKNVAIWSYNHNFSDYMAPVPMWNGLEENFRYFKELGAIHVFMEAGTDERCNFSEMKIFVCANLMWNTALKQDQLIKEFMSVYYAGAEKELYEYFTAIHKHAEWLKEKFNREMIFVQFDDEPNGRLLERRFWDKDILLGWLEIFDKALKKDLSEQVVDRVKTESLPVKFTLLYFYAKELDKNFALSLIDDMLSIAEKEKMVKAISEEEETFKAFAELWKKQINGLTE